MGPSADVVGEAGLVVGCAGVLACVSGVVAAERGLVVPRDDGRDALPDDVRPGRGRDAVDVLVGREVEVAVVGVLACADSLGVPLATPTEDPEGVLVVT